MSTSRDVDFKVLPPGSPANTSAGGGGVKAQDPLAALVARLMDSVFQIPGTGIKVGLDPLIGLIPGIGSGASSLLSALMLVRSARMGVPTVILVRMALNILINGVFDAVPVIGSAASIFYRSNDRNYALLQRYAGQKTNVTAADWAVVVAILLGIAIVIGAIIALFVVVIGKFFGFVGGLFSS